MPYACLRRWRRFPVSISSYKGGLLIRSRDLNYRVLGALNHVEDPRALVFTTGIVSGVSSNLVQVNEYDGKCYLRNGYHRAWALRAAGATHVPCLYLETNEFHWIGAVGDGATFDRADLESGNPPTCGYFTEARALEVDLRVVSRIIHVTWSEFVLPEEG